MNKLKNIEFENLNIFDHDTWVDVYISYAEWADGTPLTDDELQAIESDDIYEYIMESY